MNIKRLFALALVVLAAPLAADTTLMTSYTEADFSRAFSLQTEFGAVPVQMKYQSTFQGAKAGIVEIGKNRWIVREYADGRREQIDLSTIDTSDLVVRGDFPTLQQLRINGSTEFGATHVAPMVAPLATRVDTLVVFPNSWSSAETDMFYAELALGNERFSRILANSNNHWLTFPQVGIVRLSHDVGGSLYSPADDPEVVALRQEYHADRVIVVVDDYPYGGSAGLCGPWAVVRRDALYDAYAHELLHTVCIDHEEETAAHYPEDLSQINRAMYVCPAGGGDGFATYMTQSSPCGWYNTERLSGPGVFYQGVELVSSRAQATSVLEVAAPVAAAEMDGLPGPCVPSDTVMCLDSSNNSGDKRFELQITYSTVLGGGRSGFGHVASVEGSTESGLFSFFTPSNKEMLVKVINGCGLNNHFWVFYGTTTNVGFSLTVRDTLSPVQSSITYINNDLTFGQQGDINAFPCD